MFDEFEKSSSKNGFELDPDQLEKNNKVHILVPIKIEVRPIITYT